jgi:hypothetical protein
VPDWVIPAIFLPTLVVGFLLYARWDRRREWRHHDLTRRPDLFRFKRKQ